MRINREDREYIRSVQKTIEDCDRRNISGPRKNIATDETYLDQDRDRRNITGPRKKIVTDEKYLYQYHDRQNITGLRKKVEIDKTYLERDRRLR